MGLANAKSSGNQHRANGTSSFAIMLLNLCQMGNAISIAAENYLLRIEVREFASNKIKSKDQEHAQTALGSFRKRQVKKHRFIGSAIASTCLPQSLKLGCEASNSQNTRKHILKDLSH